ncbi:hypothetical protein KFK09_024273 [Dendrobium nobile]|uniref:Uncharacterized protein n=1 Tax=Dendrobium nobile TaxID=94219 RepID=A0A8T3AEE0_DENNO|nr:hypothetical protein KFK09_024273 [Dendrobium nobile]
MKIAAEEKRNAAAIGTERAAAPEAGDGAGASAAEAMPAREAMATPAMLKSAAALDLIEAIAAALRIAFEIERRKTRS